METYWFIFCKTDILLQKLADGTYTVPKGSEAPVEMKPWYHVLNVGELNGVKVKTFSIEAPVTGRSNQNVWVAPIVLQAYHRTLPARR